MMPKKKAVAPPDPVYRAGKKKETASKCYDLLARVISDSHNGDLLTYGPIVLKALKQYRKDLDE